MLFNLMKWSYFIVISFVVKATIGMYLSDLTHTSLMILSL